MHSLPWQLYATFQSKQFTQTSICKNQMGIFTQYIQLYHILNWGGPHFMKPAHLVMSSWCCVDSSSTCDVFQLNEWKEVNWYATHVITLYWLCATFSRWHPLPWFVIHCGTFSFNDSHSFLPDVAYINKGREYSWKPFSYSSSVSSVLCLFQ